MLQVYNILEKNFNYKKLYITIIEAMKLILTKLQKSNIEAKKI